MNCKICGIELLFFYSRNFSVAMHENYTEEDIPKTRNTLFLDDNNSIPQSTRYRLKQKLENECRQAFLKLKEKNDNANTTKNTK